VYSNGVFYFAKLSKVHGFIGDQFNLLKPNDIYICRTANANLQTLHFK